MRFPLISSSEEFAAHFRDEFWQDLARMICQRHTPDTLALQRSDHGENVVFLAGDNYIIKIYTPFRRGFAREKNALEFAAGKTSLKLPEIIAAGNMEGYNYLVMTQLEG